MSLGPWLAARQRAVDAAMTTALADAWPPRLRDALLWPIESGGKRFRPALVWAACEGVSGDPELGPALAAAVAVELVHTYSLVHDDLPCMDDDEVRRGRPTVHVAFGEGAAVLVGDALLTAAFRVLARAGGGAEARVAMVDRLATASGHVGMVAGQAADIGLGGPVTDLPALTRLHAGKTGALISAAAVLGGLAAGATPDALSALERYGEAVGLAFQLADDVLDADEVSDPDAPPSFVALLGVDETRARARQLVERAAEEVATLRSPDRLVELARYTVERSG